MEFTEKDKEQLKRLSLIIKSNGYKSAYMLIQMYEDDAPYPQSLRGVGQTSSRVIEYPQPLERVLEKIYNDSDFLWSFFEDADDFNYGEVEIHIDAMNNQLFIKARYQRLDTECHTSEFTFEDDFADRNEKPILEEYFKKMKSLGYSTGKIDYNGGGDDGYIEDHIYLDSNSNEYEHERAPEPILDLCYDLLSSNFGGWELNEGSQGSFILDFDNNLIDLEHCYNEYVYEDVDVDFPPVKF